MLKGDQINHRIYPINWVVYRRFDDLNRYKNQEQTQKKIIQINKKRVKSISLFVCSFFLPGVFISFLLYFLYIYLIFSGSSLYNPIKYNFQNSHDKTNPKQFVSCEIL